MEFIEALNFTKIQKYTLLLNAAVAQNSESDQTEHNIRQVGMFESELRFSVSGSIASRSCSERHF